MQGVSMTVELIGYSPSVYLRIARAVLVEKGFSLILLVLLRNEAAAVEVVFTIHRRVMLAQEAQEVVVLVVREMGYLELH
jgi:hypothetical protein